MTSLTSCVFTCFPYTLQNKKSTAKTKKQKQLILTIICIIYLLNKYWLAYLQTCSVVRSSQRRCFVSKGVLKNFVKFTGKHLCQSLFFFNKVAGLRHRCFFCEFCKVSRHTFFTEHHWATASNICRTAALLLSILFLFIRTSKFCLRLAVLNFVSFLRLKCS